MKTDFKNAAKLAAAGLFTVTAGAVAVPIAVLSVTIDTMVMGVRRTGQDLIMCNQGNLLKGLVTVTSPGAETTRHLICCSEMYGRTDAEKFLREYGTRFEL